MLGVDVDDSIYEEIISLSEKGNEKLDSECWEEAISIWKQALQKVPEPQVDHESYTWLNASIADAYNFGEKYDLALNHFESAYRGYGGESNAFVLFELGKAYSDRNDWLKARDFLLRAYMVAGQEIFEGEESYLDRLKQDPEIKNIE